MGLGASSERHLRDLCAFALIVAAGLHLAVGLEHPDSNFGALAFAAAAGQLALGAAALRSPSERVLQLTVLSGLILIQL